MFFTFVNGQEYPVDKAAISAINTMNIWLVLLGFRALMKGE